MRNTALKTWFTLLPLVICTGLYVFHFSLIWKYAVDVPFEDEWASFEANQLPSGVSLAGLTAQHNEHRLATTRLIIWLQYRLNGWNLAIHQKANFILYALTLVAIYWLLASEAPSHVGLALLCFMIYPLSPINHWNHFMGYQSQLHLWLLFLVIACYFFFRDSENWFDIGIGSVAATLSMYSIAGGVVSGLVLAVMFGLRKIILFRSFRVSTRSFRNLFQVLFVVGFVGGATLFWLSDYSKPPYHPALVLPYGLTFWSHFLNIVALGFGIDQLSNILGVLYFLVVLFPIVGSISIYGRNLPIGLWRSITLTLAVLGVLGSVSIGRAGFGVEQSKSSRYFELAMPLLPLSVCNWTFFLQSRKSLMAVTIASFWIICFVAFGNNWRQFRFYQREAVRREVGLKCLEGYYEGKGDGNCPTIFPAPLPARVVDEAKSLNVSFYRRITSQRGTQ